MVTLNDLISKLQSIGLSQNESKVFLFLLEFREAKTGVICSKLGIRSSHIYEVLDKLLDRGLVSYKLVNNVKVFTSVNPDNLITMFKDKEAQLQKEKNEMSDFIANLKKIEIKENKQNDFKYFEGTNGVRAMFQEVADIWTPNSNFYVASAPIVYEKWNAFLLDFFHPMRIKKQVSMQLIVPSSAKSYGKQREKFKYLEIRYDDADFKSEFGVYGDYVYFLSQSEKPYALLIKDKNFASTQIDIFRILWEHAKR